MKKTFSILILSVLILANASLATADTAETTQEQEEEERFNELLDTLAPGQDKLFSGSDKTEGGREVGFAEGDLEQKVAPRAVGILVSFSAVLAFIVFTYIGVRLVMARHNEEELTKAKDSLIHAVIGAAIIVASFAIIVGILRLFDSF